MKRLLEGIVGRDRNLDGLLVREGGLENPSGKDDGKKK
jgi:hypothetical protein